MSWAPNNVVTHSAGAFYKGGRAISTKTNSTALSYLSIISNKTVEMIGIKIIRFVEVATLSHRQEETDGFF